VVGGAGGVDSGDNPGVEPAEAGVVTGDDAGDVSVATGVGVLVEAVEVVGVEDGTAGPAGTVTWQGINKEYPLLSVPRLSMRVKAYSPVVVSS
jgi:hypothetical protein